MKLEISFLADISPDLKKILESHANSMEVIAKTMMTILESIKNKYQLDIERQSQMTQLMTGGMTMDEALLKQQEEVKKGETKVKIENTYHQ